MKKKLKVKKAALGKIIRSAVKQPSKPLINLFKPQPSKPLTNLFKPQQPRPGVPQQDPNMFSTTPPRPTYGTRPDGTRQLIHPAAGGIRPGVQPGGPPRDPNFFSTTPPRPGMQQPPGSMGQIGMVGAQPQLINPVRQETSVATPFGGGVGDPRLGAATIPGNKAQMQMRGPTQAAPVQPVPAMKKGGMVRGQGAAIRGTKFKGIF